MQSYELDWGIFSLIEFIGSCSDDIGERYKTALDIGSGAGVQTEILRHAGLEVFQLDKYSETADYQIDFIEHVFDKKFDVIYCSHVIEHQRNVGLFLDKIYDCLADDGLLLLTAPKHPVHRLVEGHLNCFVLTYFIQHLIHSGFDLAKGKLLSCSSIENAAIVPKASNFLMSERTESGYKWTQEHKDRSPVPLKLAELNDERWIFHNCEILRTGKANDIALNFPKTYQKKGIHIKAPRWNFELHI